MQQKTDFGYILGSARGDALHVVQVTGDYYGAFSKSAICGTTPAARWGSHNGWIELSRHETLQQAAAAAGHRLCKRCSQKAARLAAQAAEAEAEALAALKESGQPDQTEAAYLQQAGARAAAQAKPVKLSPRRMAEIAAGFMPDLEAEAAAEAALDASLAAVMAEADPESEAGQAWHAAQQAAEAEKQAAARAETLARFDAAGITAKVAAEHQTARAAKLAARLAAAEQAEQQQQQAEEQPAETPAAPALPCQCEHSECTHAYLSVPAGKAAAMFIGPICDACVSNMQEYLLQGTEAEAITEQVRNMYRDQREAAEALAAAEAAADPAEPATWAGNSSNWTDSCPACSDGEFHYIRQGSCWTCNYRHQTAIRAAEAAAAEALTEYPSVKRFAISAHVYLDDRGYAAVRTISRNISRAALPEILAELGRQENLSKLTAYPDLFG
jgi:hypothetical protein